MTDSWYLLYNGQQIGPMTVQEMLAYRPTPEMQVWQEGMSQWAAIYTLPELMAQINGAVPVQPMQPGAQTGTPGGPAGSGMPPVQPTYVDRKDHTTCGLFALLLGGLGIQYFYIGKTSAGIFTILLTLFTCGIWGIINLIQGIMMLTMSQADFERKYVNNTSSFPIF